MKGKGAGIVMGTGTSTRYRSRASHRYGNKDWNWNRNADWHWNENRNSQTDGDRHGAINLQTALTSANKTASKDDGRNKPQFHYFWQKGEMDYQTAKASLTKISKQTHHHHNSWRCSQFLSLSLPLPPSLCPYLYCDIESRNVEGLKHDLGCVFSVLGCV